MPFVVKVKPKGAKDAKEATVEVGASSAVQDQQQAEEHVARVCPNLEIVRTPAAE